MSSCRLAVCSSASSGFTARRRFACVCGGDQVSSCAGAPARLAWGLVLAVDRPRMCGLPHRGFSGRSSALPASGAGRVSASMLSALKESLHRCFRGQRIGGKNDSFLRSTKPHGSLAVVSSCGPGQSAAFMHALSACDVVCGILLFVC